MYVHVLDYLHAVEVTGSIPVPPTMNIRGCGTSRSLFYHEECVARAMTAGISIRKA